MSMWRWQRCCQSQSQSQVPARARARLEPKPRELAVFVLTLNEIICDDCALVAVSSRPRRRQNGQETGGEGAAGGAITWVIVLDCGVFGELEWRSDAVSWFPWHDFA